MPQLTVIYASTSGHTEYTVKKVADFVKQNGWSVQLIRVEKATQEDLFKGDALLLASSTWNTGGIEGQLNPHMHQFVYVTAATPDFNGRKVAVIGLGDHRYHFTARATDHLETYVKDNGGKLAVESLRVINEPYDQDALFVAWAKKLLSALS